MPHKTALLQIRNDKITVRHKQIKRRMINRKKTESILQYTWQNIGHPNIDMNISIFKSLK